MLQPIQTEVPDAFMALVEGSSAPTAAALFEGPDGDVQAWGVLCPREDFHPDLVGLIPSFICETDPRPVTQQIDDNYQHGGGWRPLPGMTLSPGLVLLGGDPEPYRPIAITRLAEREDQTLVIIFERGVTAVVEADGSYQVARLD
jgi:hypothetical protein